MSAGTTRAIEDLANLWDAVDRARDAAGFSVNAPAYALTVREYAERYSLDEQTARRQLGVFVKTGQFDSGRKLMVGRDGRQVIVPCFWPKE